MNANVRRAIPAAYVVGVAGFVAMITIILFFSAGQPWGTISDLALLVMTAAIPFLMLAFWELGGLTPTPLALVAQASGWFAAGAWCATQLAFVIGVLEIDYTMPATGAFAIQALTLIVIGLWIAGANLLAGPWLSALRWLGVVTGLGVVLYAAATLADDKDSPLVLAGGIAYLVLLPLWALVMGFYLARRVRAPR
ncbi:MAG TPA: hypothetical protein VFH90_05675 [Candidatus Limnocylindria bacterium]|nr:hypothetical protein [Candidatus Limnocylindria bacterium]